MRFLLSLYLCLTAWISTAATAIGAVDASLASRDRDTVPEELFFALDELARIVDVAYCVGTTGVRKPFQCLGRCEEFKGFELVKVSAFAFSGWAQATANMLSGVYTADRRLISDMAYRPSPH
jgi:hypothetical protein